MVKRLRRCPLTAESAVRFRMGLPKKNDIPWMSFFFWYTPERKRRGNLLPSFVFASANFAVVLRFTEVEKIRKGMQTETATSAWGYTLLRCVKRRGNLFAVVRQFAQANFAVVLRFTKVKSFRKSMQTETATSAWGDTTSLRGNDATTCLPSFVFASANFAVVLRFTKVEKIRKGMQTETAISAWGYTTSLRGNDAATSFLYDKRFFRLNTI